MTNAFRSGFVGLLGLPNTGKSTLLNAVVGSQLSIVTPKAQTTQRRLLGIYSGEGRQAVFIDTPGLLEPRYALHRSMREEAASATRDADVLVAVVDAGFPPSVEWAGRWAAQAALPADVPRLLCLNKMDRVPEARLGEIEAGLAEGGWRSTHRTCATEARGTAGLRAAALEALPESPPLYPVDEIATAPVREFAAELIRETCLEELSDEVPYAVAIGIEEFRERGTDGPVYIEAVAYVERESQKGIVVGRGGKMIRKIGSRARGKIERFLGRRAFLELRVKVLAGWRKKPHHLRGLGFRVPEEEG